MMEFTPEGGSAIRDLVKLQEELGYVKGPVSPVALLGLIGEAGEVLAEVNLMVKGEVKEEHADLFNVTVPFNSISATVELCKKMDGLKKVIRKGEMEVKVEINEGKLFDAELSDTFYYLVALATNRGLTVSDLARMGHTKVRAKQAAGGSSEDRKAPNG